MNHNSKMKLTRKEKEKLVRKQDIIEAAIKVFSEKGFYETSVQDIAKIVEMGVGTIYKYFKNKDDLYYNAILYKFEGFDKLLSEKLVDNKTFIDQLTTIVKVWLEYFDTNKAFFMVIFSEWANVKKTMMHGLKIRIMRKMERDSNNIKLLIEKAKRENEIRDDIDTDILNSIITGTIRDVIHRKYFNMIKSDSTTIINNIIVIVSEGIMKERKEIL
ncbi:MAG: TetR/AcrR family transcriptional regulator [Deltaproteobacteria bacterium]|nr:TetR/AcrR family transcriptional regulator [Deltaproteobacteria bacterium]MCL5792634.1 TetR/AcrR family transcriptional regulator [Deltaproteobacteria bacterium]